MARTLRLWAKLARGVIRVFQLHDPSLPALLCRHPRSLWLSGSLLGMIRIPSDDRDKTVDLLTQAVDDETTCTGVRGDDAVLELRRVGVDGDSPCIEPSSEILNEI